MSEVIVITSGKGGVGKTTATSANVREHGLAQLGNKVVLIDTVNSELQKIWMSYWELRN